MKIISATQLYNPSLWKPSCVCPTVLPPEILFIVVLHRIAETQQSAIPKFLGLNGESPKSRSDFNRKKIFKIAHSNYVFSIIISYKRSNAPYPTVALTTDEFTDLVANPNPNPGDLRSLTRAVQHSNAIVLYLLM